GGPSPRLTAALTAVTPVSPLPSAPRRPWVDVPLYVTDPGRRGNSRRRGPSARLRRTPPANSALPRCASCHVARDHRFPLNAGVLPQQRRDEDASLSIEWTLVRPRHVDVHEPHHLWIEAVLGEDLLLEVP